MPWGAAIGAGISLIGSEMQSDKKGGAGTQTQTNEPWAPAAPWLLQNVNSGQALQQQYTDRPFSARQLAAYDNSYAQSDAMRALIPSLLGQLGDQPVGFDKNNRSARPKAWDWDSFMASLANGGGSVRGAQDPVAAPAAAPAPEFRQQDMGYSQNEQALLAAGLNPFLLGHTQSIQSGGVNGGLGTGGYGAYVYGSTPQPGTQAYRDMNEYFLLGGNDPWNLGGALGVKRAGAPGNVHAGTSGGGDGVSSSAPTGNDY